jgi:hypothetical protein
MFTSDAPILTLGPGGDFLRDFVVSSDERTKLFVRQRPVSTLPLELDPAQVERYASHAATWQLAAEHLAAHANRVPSAFAFVSELLATVGARITRSRRSFGGWASRFSCLAFRCGSGLAFRSGSRRGIPFTRVVWRKSKGGHTS